MKSVFVSSTENSLGIGKIVRISKETVVVEYFISVGCRIEKQVSVKSLTPVVLHNQTRCYLFSKESQSWLAARIGARDSSDNTYEVNFPNNRARYIPEGEIYVRCQKPVEDPTDTLALRSHETPFFHDRRQAFVHCLTRQRTVAHGMTGLLSSNILLYPHQTEVARRILEDPIQRYLLADEVGLGKTIEAGIILRQYLLDAPKKSALVITPSTLTEQWSTELKEKFNISDFGSRIKIISTDNLTSDSLLKNIDELGFLIIDEAHHIAAGAHLPSHSRQRLQFETCRRLAHHAKQLLLLSATPVLNNEKDFLAMLHLLDPVTYQLEDFEAFRERVNKRQDIGRILLSFKENSPTFIIKATLNRLRDVFPNDNPLLSFISELQLLLESPTSDSNKQKFLIRSIRTHISDTYRLHRRMLRNHRESVNLPRRLSIDNAAADLKEEYDDDHRGLRVHDLIDDWRGYALQFVNSLEVDNEDAEAVKLQLQRIFTTLVRASGTWLGVLEKVLLVRLSQSNSQTIAREFAEKGCDTLLTTVPLFPRESELLREMLETVRQPARNPDRIQLLTSILKRIKNSNTKAVVFTNFASTQEEIVQHLRSAYGMRAVASHDSTRSRAEIEDDLYRFQKSTDCFVLVSDASGEEGLNLQFADWIIHFDLPWSPNRLEQRIGRLDRIGRNRSVKTRTLLGPESEDTLYDAWYQMLKEGLGIFETSIAGLQFYIDEKLPALESILFNNGAAGLLHSIPQMQDEIKAEELKINEQNALDEIDVLEANALNYFEKLQKYDDQHRVIQKAYENWICEVLKFRVNYNDETPDVVTYIPTDNTLVPTDVLKTQFTSLMSEPGTYNRKTAAKYPGNRLFRIGEPLTQALARYVRVDDRGQAFAMWRHCENWSEEESADWAGFRFNYIVEANLKAAKQILLKHNLSDISQKALLRRADALFPPFMYTKFLDINLQEVIDEELLKILILPYVKEGSDRCDYNLNFERFNTANHLIDPGLWSDTCKRARAKSEETLLNSEQFQRFCKSYAFRAKKEMLKRNEQLRLRVEREIDLGLNNEVLSEELSLEEELQTALIRGILKPQVRLDSVGFIVISGRPPAY
jgi:ATP-dependent helicase HepA